MSMRRSRGTKTSSGFGSSGSSWYKKPEDSGPRRARGPPSRMPPQARESHDGSSGTVKNKPREPAPRSGFQKTADAMAAQAMAECLIQGHYVSLHRCKVEQSVLYVMSLMHVVSMLSWAQIVRRAGILWIIRRPSQGLWISTQQSGRTPRLFDHGTVRRVKPNAR
jgi:hypothetical protein